MIHWYKVAECIAYCCAQIHTRMDLDIGCGCGCVLADGCSVWKRTGKATVRHCVTNNIDDEMRSIYFHSATSHSRQPYYIHPIYQFIEFSACK